MTELNRRDFLDLGPTLFEQLVGSLVRIEHPDATTPAAPDGGADVLVPERDGRPALVWQVKHFESNEPPWKKCEDSLKQAIRYFTPREVTFVFSRDLTAGMLRKFKTRLEDHDANVAVRQWGIFELRELLDRHPEVRRRYFGDDGELPAILRSLSQGGQPLETGDDLVQRATALTEFANSDDPNFLYAVQAGSIDVPETTWTDTPYIVMTTVTGDHRIQIPAWPRPEADIQPVQAGFTDDAAGEAALELARRRLASGEDAELTSGLWLRIPTAPTLMQSLGDTTSGDHVATLKPGKGVPLTMSVGFQDGVLSYAFDLRPVPPRRTGVHSYGAITSGLELWLDLEPLAFPRMRLHLEVGFHPVADYMRSGLAAGFVAAAVSGGLVKLDAPGFLPPDATSISIGAQAARTGRMLEATSQLYLGLAVVQRVLGVRLDAPASATWGEIQDLLSTAEAVQVRSGTMSVGEIQQELDNEQVGHFIGSIDRAIIRTGLTREIFQQAVTLGRAEFPAPPFALVVPTKEGMRPGRTLVRLVPVTGSKVKFRLLELGGDSATWRSEIIIDDTPSPLRSGLLLDADGQRSGP